MNRRNFLIQGIGLAIIAGLTPTFLPHLVDLKALWLDEKLDLKKEFLDIYGRTLGFEDMNFSLDLANATYPGILKTLPSYTSGR